MPLFFVVQANPSNNSCPSTSSALYGNTLMKIVNLVLLALHLKLVVLLYIVCQVKHNVTAYGYALRVANGLPPPMVPPVNEPKFRKKVRSNHNLALVRTYK